MTIVRVIARSLSACAVAAGSALAPVSSTGNRRLAASAEIAAASGLAGLTITAASNAGMPDVFCSAVRRSIALAIAAAVSAGLGPAIRIT